VYICVSLEHALTFQTLSKETKTRILIKLAEKFCPEIKYSEWNEIFSDVENIRPEIIKQTLQIIQAKDYAIIAEQHQKIFGYSDDEYIEKLENLDNTKLKIALGVKDNVD